MNAENRNEYALDVLKFVHVSERLKSITRHGWTSDGRQESVAEHSWRLALMVILLHSRLSHPINLEKALSMAIIHDLPEVIVGDVPFFEALEGSPRQKEKHEQEKQAIKQLSKMVSPEEGSFIYDLWMEYHNSESNEARFVKALDKIEAQIQQNEADISTWNDFEKLSIFTYLDKFCDYEPFLKEFKQVVRKESASCLCKAASINEQIER